MSLSHKFKNTQVDSETIATTYIYLHRKTANILFWSKIWFSNKAKLEKRLVWHGRPSDTIALCFYVFLNTVKWKWSVEYARARLRLPARATRAPRCRFATPGLDPNKLNQLGARVRIHRKWPLHDCLVVPNEANKRSLQNTKHFFNRMCPPQLSSSRIKCVWIYFRLHCAILDQLCMRLVSLPCH